MDLKEFIYSNRDKCIRENREDNGTLIGLPHPYSVPNTGCFDEMYYWDTYFTNRGLFLSGRGEQAKNNVDNMLFLVKKYGFMPNGNRTGYLHNTQPPYLSEMVKDVYEAFGDKNWLAEAYKILKIEYSFWKTKRMTPTGLCAYGGNELGDETVDFYAKIFKDRTGFSYDDENKYDIAHHSITCAESGWDMNPKWGTDGYNYVTVDLNSLLFGFEKNMGFFARELGFSGDEWENRSENRKMLMKKYLLCDDGLMHDYNFETKTHSKIMSATAFYPLFTGAADKEYAAALVENIDRIKGKFGIFACEKNESDCVFQWDYPNGWPCMQYIAVRGLADYGYIDLAHELAQNYVSVLEKNFELTGNLWEKYNMNDGSINTCQEHNATDDLPVMMGWTAGTYLFCRDFIEK